MKTYKIRNKADGGILEITEDQLAAYGLEVPNQMAKGGMIKRADGSYSRRGLWDNIRANKGSGKKPTKAMLAQEKKIRAAEKAYGGYMDMGGYMNPYMNYGGYMASGGCMECGGKMQDGGEQSFAQYMKERKQMEETMVDRSKPYKPLPPSKIIDYPPTYGIIEEKQLLPNPVTRLPIGRTNLPFINQPVPFMESGGKIPKEVLLPRLESHMSPKQAHDYLNTYGMGGYLDEAGDGKWIQKATASIKRRGTEGVCTGSKFGGPGCPPGSKRYNLAKTFRKMAKSKKEEGGYTQGGEYEMTDAEIAKLRSMGYKVKEV